MKKVEIIPLLAFVMIFLFSLSASAVPSARPTLKEQIARISKQIKALQSRRDKLLPLSEEFADKISAIKRHLQEGDNPLLQLRLKKELKTSREVTDRIQKMDKEIRDLTEQSITLKKELIADLSGEIDSLSKDAIAAKNAGKVSQSRRLFQRILQLQKERENYQAHIIEESNELLLMLDVEILDDDGPDDILQKAAIVEDQRDIVRSKAEKLKSQIEDKRKELDLRKNMLELLRDIGSDEEEFNPGGEVRIAELEEEIEKINISIKVMRAKRKILQRRERELTEKARRFYKEASKLLKPPSNEY